MVVVSSGCTLTEALLSSPICRGEDGAAAPVVAAGGGGFEFGIDPEDDPDLALVRYSSFETCLEWKSSCSCLESIKVALFEVPEADVAEVCL